MAASWKKAELKSLQAVLEFVQNDAVAFGEAHDIVIEHCRTFGCEGFEVATDKQLLVELVEEELLEEGKALVVAEVQHAVQAIAQQLSASP